MQKFSFIQSIKLSEETKRLLAVPSFKATNSVFNITARNKSVSISTSSNWTPECGEELINKLNEGLELRSQYDFELYVKEVKKEALE